MFTESLSERLAQFADLVNRCGVDSRQVLDVIYANRHDEQFTRYAQLSRDLKRALNRVDER